MAHGLLTGTMPRESTFDERDWRRQGNIFGQRLFGPNLNQNLEVADRLAEGHEAHRHVAYAAGARMGPPPSAVSVALSGCCNPREIEENVRAVDVRLAPDVLSEIDGLMAAAAGQSEVIPGRHHTP